MTRSVLIYGDVQRVQARAWQWGLRWFANRGYLDKAYRSGQEGHETGRQPTIRPLTEFTAVRGISPAALIRSLIDELLGRNRAPEQDPPDNLIGIGQGSGDPVGREHNRHLYEARDA